MKMKEMKEMKEKMRLIILLTVTQSIGCGGVRLRRRSTLNTLGEDRRRQPRRPGAALQNLQNCVLATAVCGGGGNGDGEDGDTVRRELRSSSISSSSPEMSAALS
jgi:hypothetical protein